jgi:hypothetical protein
MLRVANDHFSCLRCGAANLETADQPHRFFGEPCSGIPREPTPRFHDELSLADTLLQLGLAHVPSAVGFGARDIVDRTGAIVFHGSASETWKWLRETHRIARKAA